MENYKRVIPLGSPPGEPWSRTAVEALGVKTKREAVTIALQEAIARREQRKLLDLEGSIEWLLALTTRRIGWRAIASGA